MLLYIQHQTVEILKTFLFIAPPADELQSFVSYYPRFKKFPQPPFLFAIFLTSPSSQNFQAFLHLSSESSFSGVVTARTL
jgi:hypothetical protein